MDEALLNTLNAIVANATPLAIAALGETITERAGVINLSLNGSILLSAMFGFVAAQATNSLIAGIALAILVGALVALIVAVGGITLRQDQVAVGFVLTLLTADLATFLGQEYTNTPGPIVPNVPLPLLRDLPLVGAVFFDHTPFVYFSFVLALAVWFWLFRTRPGLEHRAIGERPAAAFARGAHVNRQRYLYTVIGGGLVGLAGAAYSLGLKPGWLPNPPMNGDGWIALAIVIFGGWHPARVMFGAYLFAGLRALASVIQRSPDLNIPIVLLNALPWVLMLLTLLLVSGGVLERVVRILPRRMQNRVSAFLRSDPPAALGTRFDAG